MRSKKALRFSESFFNAMAASDLPQSAAAEAKIGFTSNKLIKVSPQGELNPKN